MIYTTMETGIDDLLARMRAVRAMFVDENELASRIMLDPIASEALTQLHASGKTSAQVAFGSESSEDESSVMDRLTEARTAGGRAADLLSSYIGRHVSVGVSVRREGNVSSFHIWLGLTRQDTHCPHCCPAFG